MCHLANALYFCIDIVPVNLLLLTLKLIDNSAVFSVDFCLPLFKMFDDWLDVQLAQWILFWIMFLKKFFKALFFDSNVFESTWVIRLNYGDPLDIIKLNCRQVILLLFDLQFPRRSFLIIAEPGMIQRGLESAVTALVRIFRRLLISIFTARRKNPTSPRSYRCCGLLWELGRLFSLLI